MSNRSSATIINNGNELTINCTKAENIVRPNKNGEYYYKQNFQHSEIYNNATIGSSIKKCIKEIDFIKHDKNHYYIDLNSNIFKDKSEEQIKDIVKTTLYKVITNHLITTFNIVINEHDEYDDVIDSYIIYLLLDDINKNHHEFATNFNYMLDALKDKVRKINKINLLKDMIRLDKMIRDVFDEYGSGDYEIFKEDVINRIKNEDANIIALYAKKVSRQNIFERTQIYILKKTGYINNNHIVITDIVNCSDIWERIKEATLSQHPEYKLTKQDKRKISKVNLPYFKLLENDKTKTYDVLCYDINTKQIIAYCIKYVKGPGGNQDNQITDLTKFNIKEKTGIDKVYLVMSGEYGITQIKNKFGITSSDKINDDKIIKLHENVNIMFMNDNIEIKSAEDQERILKECQKQ